MDPKEKNLFVVNSKKNLSTEMDVLWSTKGPDFINSKSLVALCREGSLRLSSASSTMPHSFMLSESILAGEFWFCLSIKELKSAPFKENCRNCILVASVLTNHN